MPDRTFKFVIEIIHLSRKLEKRSGSSRTLANQLIRSGISVGANVEEGQASQSRVDFLSKYSIACKEARETLYWLKLLTASELLSPEQTATLRDACNQIIAILTSITKKLWRKNNAYFSRFFSRGFFIFSFSLRSSPF